MLLIAYSLFNPLINKHKFNRPFPLYLCLLFILQTSSFASSSLHYAIELLHFLFHSLRLHYLIYPCNILLLSFSFPNFIHFLLLTMSKCALLYFSSFNGSLSYHTLSLKYLFRCTFFQKHYLISSCNIQLFSFSFPNFIHFLLLTMSKCALLDFSSFNGSLSYHTLSLKYLFRCTFFQKHYLISSCNIQLLSSSFPNFIHFLLLTMSKCALLYFSSFNGSLSYHTLSLKYLFKCAFFQKHYLISSCNIQLFSFSFPNFIHFLLLTMSKCALLYFSSFNGSLSYHTLSLKYLFRCTFFQKHYLISSCNIQLLSSSFPNFIHFLLLTMSKCALLYFSSFNGSLSYHTLSLKYLFKCAFFQKHLYFHYSIFM